jgi:drug/metabolite transporter (DMT)-like permease
VLIAAVGYGTLGVLARLAGEAGVSTIGFVSWRAVLGTAFLAAGVAMASHLGLVRRVRLSGVPAVHWLQLGSVAGLSIVANLAMFAGFERAAIGVVMICFYTYPIIVAVAATRLYGEHLDGRRMASLALALSGLALMVLAPGVDEMGGWQPVGMALGLVAALAQAGYALIAGRGYASLPAAQAAVAIASFTAVGFVSLALVGGAAAALTEPFVADDAWPWLILAGALGLAIPTAAVLAGFRRLGPTRASILMLLEPVVAVVLAATLLAERPTSLQVLGGVLVLSGSLLAQSSPRPAEAMPPLSGVA